MVRPEEKSPARNVKYFKNKQDNEVEDNQSVYVFKCEGSTVKVRYTTAGASSYWFLIDPTGPQMSFWPLTR